VAMLFRGHDSASSTKEVAAIKAVTSNYNWISGELAFYTRTGDVMSESMRIDGDGNVGIGTTSPGAKLEIDNTANSWNMSSLATAISDLVAFRIRGRAGSTATLAMGATANNTIGLQVVNDAGTDSDSISLNPFGGNVGIGTTTPQSLLSLGNAVDAQKLLLYDYGAGNYSKYGFGIQSNELRMFAPAGVDTHISFGSIANIATMTWVEHMRIETDTGNVGIGVTDPDTALEVVGKTKSSTGFETGNFEMVHNATSDSLDFNYIG